MKVDVCEWPDVKAVETECIGSSFGVKSLHSKDHVEWRSEEHWSNAKFIMHCICVGRTYVRTEATGRTCSIESIFDYTC